jgi:hypothetical protein
VVHKVYKEPRELKVTKVHRVLLELKVYKEPKVFREHRVIREHKETGELKEPKD